MKTFGPVKVVCLSRSLYNTTVIILCKSQRVEYLILDNHSCTFSPSSKRAV